MALDEREVRARSDALQKALSGREPTSNVLNILRELQKGVKPSEELLRKTQVGKIVNKIKSLQTVDPAIPQLASEIVSQWRNQIRKSSGAATPTPSSNQTNGNGSASPAPSSTPQPTSSSKADTTSADSKLPTGVPLDKRTHKTDNISKSTLTSSPARNNSIGLLYDGLVMSSSLPPNQVLNIAKQVESSVLAQPNCNSDPSSAFYKERIRTLYQNLKNKANPELRTRVLSGAITPASFAGMTHDEMKGERQKAEEAKIAKENLNNAMVAQEERSISEHLECGKCKQKKVSFTQAQTRSADEPMTTFCTCEHCGHRWKFS